MPKPEHREWIRSNLGVNHPALSAGGRSAPVQTGRGTAPPDVIGKQTHANKDHRHSPSGQAAHRHHPARPGTNGNAANSSTNPARRPINPDSEDYQQGYQQGRTGTAAFGAPRDGEALADFREGQGRGRHDDAAEQPQSHGQANRPRPRQSASRRGDMCPSPEYLQGRADGMSGPEMDPSLVRHDPIEDYLPVTPDPPDGEREYLRGRADGRARAAADQAQRESERRRRHAALTPPQCHPVPLFGGPTQTPSDGPVIGPENTSPPSEEARRQRHERENTERFREWLREGPERHLPEEDQHVGDEGTGGNDVTEPWRPPPPPDPWTGE